MNKIFPNMETAIIALFLLVICLWGVSRCRKKKTEASIETAATAVTTIDTSARAQSQVASPAMGAPATATVPPPMPVSTLPAATPAVPTATTAATTAPPVSPAQVATSSATAKPTVPAPVAAATSPAYTQLYVIADGLHVRVKPDLKAKSLGRLSQNDRVFFLEETSEVVQTVRLQNGKEVTKPWFKIKTKKGTVGWVHGSGIDFYKRKPTE